MRIIGTQELSIVTLDGNEYRRILSERDELRDALSAIVNSFKNQDAWEWINNPEGARVFNEASALLARVVKP